MVPKSAYIYLSASETTKQEPQIYYKGLEYDMTCSILRHTFHAAHIRYTDR
jgi:hypothetical protein